MARFIAQAKIDRLRRRVLSSRLDRSAKEQLFALGIAEHVFGLDWLCKHLWGSGHTERFGSEGRRPYLQSQALVALPFIQCYGYLHFRSSSAFFAPLVAVVGFLMFVSIAAPRAVIVVPLDHREWLLWFGVILGGLAAALLLPATGTILVLRGALIDVAAYSLATLLIRITHLRRSGASST